MGSFEGQFVKRAALIPVHGIGLSADVYDPDLLELHQALDQAGERPAYLEVFKARTLDLARIRAALPGIPLAYHAEGLWMIEPELRRQYPWSKVVETIARHAHAIGSHWANHECASKQFGGYSFGTYLPPLFTRAAAEATVVNAVLCQAGLDAWYAQQGRPASAPLLLLELPPLTYFAFGDLAVEEFFARIVEKSSCGLVLDLGHLWTIWRYKERRRFQSLESFTENFLDAFPLDRVVQIHLAGLGFADGERSFGTLPLWVDAHATPVPAVLLDLLRQVLARPGLTSLKGVALEVDTKAIPLIIEEFGRFKEEFGSKAKFIPSSLPSPSPVAGDPLLDPLHPKSNGHPEKQRIPRATGTPRAGMNPAPTFRSSPSVDEKLADLYQTYARVVSGQEAIDTSTLASFAGAVDREGLVRYTTRYLPWELLSWGGDLKELFPAIWRTLEERSLTGEDFVRFWFQRPCPVTEPYDYFYVKLERWVAFVGEVAPDLLEETSREAEILRAGHAELNDECPLTLSPETGARDSMGAAAPIFPSPLEGRVRGNQ